MLGIAQQRPQAEAGRDEVGVELDHRAELGDRFLHLLLILEREAKAIVSHGKIGLQPGQFAVRGNDLVQVPLAAQGKGEVVDSQDVVGLESDRLRGIR